MHIHYCFSIYNCYFDFVKIIETWQNNWKNSVDYIIHKFIWNLFKIVLWKQNADEWKFNVDEFDFVFLILFCFFSLCEHELYDLFVLKWWNDVMTPRHFCLLKRFFIPGLGLRVFFSFNFLIVSIVLPHGPTSDWCQIGVWDKSNQSHCDCMIGQIIDVCNDFKMNYFMIKFNWLRINWSINNRIFNVFINKCQIYDWFKCSSGSFPYARDFIKNVN